VIEQEGTSSTGSRTTDVQFRQTQVEVEVDALVSMPPMFCN
jgi:hypothetical protein